MAGRKKEDTKRNRNANTHTNTDANTNIFSYGGRQKSVRLRAHIHRGKSTAASRGDAFVKNCDGDDDYDDGGDDTGP